MSRLMRNSLDRREPIPASTCEMFAATHLVGFGAVGEFTPLGVDFDGTNDYMTRGTGFTGASDSALLLFATWFRLDGGDGSTLVFLHTDNGVGRTVFIARQSDNTLRVEFQDPPFENSFIFTTSAAYTASPIWHSLIVSADMGAADTHQIVIDGALVSNTLANNGASTADFTTSNWGVGATSTGANKFNGCLAEYYVALGQSLDLTVPDNVAKFISGVKPVDLGADGSLPMGGPPTAYFSVRSGGTASDFAINRGTGGNVTVTGSLELASSNPALSASVSLIEAIQQLALTTNLKLCLDAAESTSYSGSGQTWSDISGAGNNVFRGSTSGVEGSDPAFNGIAGRSSSAEYWSLDGSDYFVDDGGQPAYTASLHKDNAKFTLLAVVYAPASIASGSFRLFMTGASPGMEWVFQSGPQNLRVYDGGGSFVRNVQADAIGATNGWVVVALSLDEAIGAGGGFFWENGAYKVVGASNTFSSTYSSPSAAAPSDANMGIGSRGEGSNPLPAGSRVAAFAVWEGTALTKAQLDGIYHLIKTRWGL